MDKLGASDRAHCVAIAVRVAFLTFRLTTHAESPDGRLSDRRLIQATASAAILARAFSKHDHCLAALICLSAGPTIT